MNIIELAFELKRTLDKMDVPENRKTDFGWLLRNLGIRNSNHPDFEKAVGLIREFEALKTKIFDD